MGGQFNYTKKITLKNEYLIIIIIILKGKKKKSILFVIIDKHRPYHSSTTMLLGAKFLVHQLHPLLSATATFF